MIPADEATFIELWNEGIATAEIGRQLNIPRGTVSSRAKRLVEQGKIQPRPRGGAYPKQQALARQHQAPVQTGADMHGAETVQSGAELPIPVPLAEELRRLWAQ